MTAKRFLARADEAQGLHDGRITEVRRPMKPQPYMVLPRKEWDSRALSGVDSYMRPIGSAVMEELIEGAPHPTGSRVWVAEACVEMRALGEPCGRFLYRADARDSTGERWPSVQPGDPENEVLWVPASRVSRRMSRTTLEVVAVRVDKREVWEWVYTMRRISDEG